MAEKTTWREELEEAVLDAIADLVDFLTSFLFWISDSIDWDAFFT